MAELPFSKILTIPSGSNVSNSYQIGRANDPVIPISVLMPSNLRSTVRLKFQVSMDDSTYVDVLLGTTLLFLTETASKLVLVPDTLQVGPLGWSFIRLAAMDASNVDQNASADVAFTVYFAPVNLDNEAIQDPNGNTVLSAGSALVGKVGIDQTTPGTTNQVNASTNISTIKTTVTRPADTNAYAAGDCFSNSTSAPTTGGGTFTAAARASGGTGKITDAIISMSAKSAFQGEIWVFDQAATSSNDNAAITLSAADALNLVGVIPFNVNDTGSVAGISYVNGLDIRYTCVGTANLRFLVKVIAGFTPASAEVLGVTLKVEN